MVHTVKAMVFSLFRYGCESWTIKKAECQRIDAFELWCWRLLRAPWTTRRSNLGVNPERNQLWIFTERTDAEVPILWPPNAKGQLIGKDTDAGKDWRQEKGVTEHKTVGWHNQLNEHEFEQAPGDEGQGSLAYCSPWGCKELDVTKRLNTNNNLKFTVQNRDYICTNLIPFHSPLIFPFLLRN